MYMFTYSQFMRAGENWAIQFIWLLIWFDQFITLSLGLIGWKVRWSNLSKCIKGENADGILQRGEACAIRPACQSTWLPTSSTTPPPRLSPWLLIDEGPAEHGVVELSRKIRPLWVQSILFITCLYPWASFTPLLLWAWNKTAMSF